MFPRPDTLDPDTYYAALKVERQQALRQAERRALATEAASRPNSAAASAGSAPALPRWDRLARAARPLRQLFRPAHA